MVKLEDEGSDVAVGEAGEEACDVGAFVDALRGFGECWRGAEVQDLKSLVFWRGGSGRHVDDGSNPWVQR